MNSKLVSVIIPIYNAEKYLKQCLESIINQTYKNIEIILVDDGSNDDSYFIADAYAKKDVRIKVFHKTNSGVSSARNCGLEETNGDLALFVDADDWLELDAVEVLVGVLEDTDADIVWCDYILEVAQENKLEIIGDCKINHVEGKMELIKYMIGYPKIRENVWMGTSLWNKLFKMKIIKDNRITFQENVSVAEDMYFNFQYLLWCKCGSSISRKLYHYRQNEGSIMDIYRRKFDPFILELPRCWERAYRELKMIGNTISLDYEELLDFFASRTTYCFHSVLWRMVIANYRDPEFFSSAKMWINNNGKALFRDSLVSKKIKISISLFNFNSDIWCYIIKKFAK